MGWVTLSLRTMELQRTHSDLQMQDLNISREQRQMARQYQTEQLMVQNEQKNEVGDLQVAYRNDRSAKYDYLKDLRTDLSDDSLSESEKAEINSLIEQTNQELRELQTDYQENSDSVKTMYEDELAMIEQEANDIEVMYENEKVQIETQMEAVAAELQAVKDATSQEIQNGVIKLK